MTARMRRLASDWEQVKKDFAGHQNIIITPVGEEPPEKYHITYFVNGIYLAPDKSVQTLARHEVEITLHAEYPRYKPICKILTPIWHPNFRDGQICIGDIWGAGESLSDIIINIGHMIQYKSWNSFSPLCAEAAQWAIENKQMFPVGNVDLYIADYASEKDKVEIDLFDAEGETDEKSSVEETETSEAQQNEAQSNETNAQVEEQDDGNDFEITAEELAGISFVPTAQRMQSINKNSTAKGKKINFKTVLVKGLLWAFIGALLGFAISEFSGGSDAGRKMLANLFGYTYLADYYEYSEKADEAFDVAYSEYESYCKANGLYADDFSNFEHWYENYAHSTTKEYLDDYTYYNDLAEEALYNSYMYEFDSNEYRFKDASKTFQRAGTGVWSAIIALFIGLFLGLGEGIFYGSKEKAAMYAAIGAGVSLVLGFISGYIAQWMYSELLPDDPAKFAAAFIRGLGWSIMGLGIGIAIGLIKPEKKRLLFCSLGGLGGGFLGGFLFNYICEIIPGDLVARGAAIVIMGLLIGVGVGLLEQFAKQAWLKVVRGEFEGKEYLVFAGTTSIGNNGKNTIVLFKDKLVGPHHCDIVLEGSKYILYDRGTPMGTVVNGMRITNHALRQGDAIAIGNSVLVFNTK